MPRAAVASNSEDEGPRFDTRQNRATRVKQEKIKKEKTRKAATPEQDDDEEMDAEQDPSGDEHSRSNDSGHHARDTSHGQGTSRGNKRQRVNDAGDSRSTTSPGPSGSGAGDEEEEGGEPQAPSRKTLPRDVDGFIPGSIVRIQLKNFVTYDFVEFKPGAHLNMILGPNGTGKSSIACAIALGLNFPPSVLGRATEVNAFVKNNTTEGYIEIELKGPAGKKNLVIKRTLRAQDNKTSFFLNGEAATGKEITNRMAELNVQVGNLCSFLPQDKVSSFAAMTPRELLVETQKAAGDPNLSSWFETLKEYGDIEKNEKQKLKDDKESCKQMEDRNAGIENDVERFKERQKIEQEIAFLEVAVPIATYREKKAELNKVKARAKKAAAKVKRLEAKNKPAHDKLREYERKEERAKRTREEKKSELISCTKEMKRRYDRLEELDKEAQEITDKLGEVKRAERQRLATIKATEGDIAQLEELLKKEPPNVGTSEQLADQMKLVHLEKNGIKAEFNERNEELKATIAKKAFALQNIARVEDSIKRLQSPDSKKLAMLERWDSDSHQAVLWLRQHKHLFSMEVFEPPIISCAVKSSEYAPYVEAFFNPSQMKMFVAQCKSDLDILNKHINDSEVNGKKLRIATWYKDCNDSSFAAPPMTQEQLRELGFDGYALDYMEYPPGMENYLKDMNLHRNAISRNSNIDVARAMEVVGKSGGAWFTNGRTLNQVSRSRYGRKAVGNMTRDIPDAKSFVHPPVDTAAQQRLQQEINNYRLEVEEAEVQRNALSPQMDAIKARDKANQAVFEETKAKQKQLADFAKEQAGYQRRLNSARQLLDDFRNKPSADEERNRLKAKLLSNCEKRLKIAKECRDAAKNILKKQIECAEAGFALVQAEANKRHLENLCDEKDKKHVEAHKAAVALAGARDRMRDETAAVLNDIRTVVQNLDDKSETKARVSVYQNTWIAYQAALTAAKNGSPPDSEGVDLRTRAELEEELGSQQTALELIINTNPGVLEEYQNRQRAIEQLQKTIKERDEKIAASEKRIKSIRDKWLPALEKLVASVNSRFSAAFDGIGCAGEIRLKQDEDYRQWAIEIYVKFRDTERLQLLTGQRQSGGERSLTTILYLMALTEEARAPFSLVDEINQGMDQRAERVVHNSMVNVTCKEDSAQYFLITPKLLTDLKYYKRMKILCVNNGEWLPEERGLGNMMNMIEGFVAHRAANAH